MTGQPRTGQPTTGQPPTGQPPTGQAAAPVVALCVDLMDRSKISAAFPDAQLVRSFSALVEATDATTIALVDLRRVDNAAGLATVAGRVIAFGSHVDEETLAAATDAGVEALPRSVFFRRLGDSSLI